MRLIIVSNRLPVTAIKKTDGYDFKPSVGGLATGLKTFIKSSNNKIVKKEDCIWIGWPGLEIPEEDQNDFKESLRNDHNYYPVFLDKIQIKEFYYGFCNSTLWPLFHYFSSEAKFKDNFWARYKEVNKVFLDAILEIVREDDVLWIHDYHLLLLPQLVRRIFPKISIGFFLHIPFPSYELFEHLSITIRNALLSGVLGSDLIGFHTKDYSQNFLRSVSKILGVKSKNGLVRFSNRTTRIGVFPMGIDYDGFQKESATVYNERNKFKNECGCDKVILSVDRLDYTKGIINRLKAYRYFLKQNIQWHSRIVLLLIIAPCRTELKVYRKLKKDIDTLVGEINGLFGSTNWLPIHYQYKQLSFEEIISVYTFSDIALITPLRDGMNLIAKEFLASKMDNKGVLILSETAGVSHELLEAEIINPFNIKELALAIQKSLSISEEKQIERNSKMGIRIKENDIMKWVEDFILNTLKVKSEDSSFNHKMIKMRIFN